MERLTVVKTGKLWIGGAWPRSESGQTFTIDDSDGQVLARCALASRKDARDAVEAARKAVPRWRDATATLRGQVLYRIAEMLESRAEEFTSALETQGLKQAAARQEVEDAIDRMVMLAGWCDKIHQLLGCQNPVACHYHNFTVPQACGVVALMSPDSPSLLGLVTLVGAAMVMGNAVVAVVPREAALCGILLGESMGVSDVPGGVVNVLTGDVAALLEPLGGHREVAVTVAAGCTKAQRTTLRTAAADGIRRVHIVGWSGSDWGNDDETCSPWFLEQFVEFKTLWHPSAS